MLEYPVAIRTKNSYTDGVHQAEEFNTLDNQAAFWIPFNDDSAEITYNMRFLISNNPKHPQAYMVTKINDILRPGIVEVILLQDQLGDFDNGDIMCADYDIEKWKCDINILNADDNLNLPFDMQYPLQVSGSINDMPVDTSYFTFTSNNSEIAEVDSNGMITTYSQIGSCTISITLGNSTKTFAINVDDRAENPATLSLVDPDGDNILRLRFDKTLSVISYYNGIETQMPDLQCELLDGGDIASVRVEDDAVIISATPEFSNIGRTVSVRVFSQEYGVEDVQNLVIKGVI